MRRRNATPCFLIARFEGRCAETGKPIHKGDLIAYFPASRQSYHKCSKAADQVRALQFATAHGMADANY
jgi:hypothetical protein